MHPFHTGSQSLSLHAVANPRVRYLGGYIGFGLGYVLLVAVRSIINLLAGWKASRTIHHASMASLCLAPISFFDTTPIGRILNRFAKVSTATLPPSRM